MSEPTKWMERMRECVANDDTEGAHCDADSILCEVLRATGFGDLVDEYHKVDKWFA